MAVEKDRLLNTVAGIELFFAVHFGTYTKDATVKISEVFDVFKEIKERIEETIDDKD